MSLKQFLFKKPIKHNNILISLAVLLATFYNPVFWQKTLAAFPWTQNSLFVVGIFILLVIAFMLLLWLFDFPYILKPFLCVLLFFSASCLHVVNTYATVVDDTMIQNIFHSDWREAKDLFSLNLLLTWLFFWVLPVGLFITRPILYPATRLALIKNKLIVLLVLILCVAGVFAVTSKSMISFFREHKTIRSYTNPTYWIYSMGVYFKSQFEPSSVPLTRIALDAKKTPQSPRKLLIFVVGETARSDHFSLNGYSQRTNPYLEKRNILSLKNVSSCGTSTAISVPCMFSMFDRSDFDAKTSKHTENILDVLGRNQVHILWRDNNSSSKGVADRIRYEDFRIPKNNPLCNPECRDEGMLHGLDQFIAQTQSGDILIVLHQMGSHGPAYHKRYPTEFEHFQPVCKTVELSQCPTEALINAYDNSIVYTDYFLSKAIDFLQKQDKQFATALFYVSDHGESLGENGLYLHGLPYAIAPKAQTQVPMILWFSDALAQSHQNVASKQHNAFSHHHVFHTLLGFFDIQTQIYNAKYDMTATP